MTTLPLQDWCPSGLCIVNYPVHAEYGVLQQVTSALENQSLVIIHAKEIKTEFKSKVTFVDAMGHALTAQTALRRRISDSEGSTVLEDPADTQALLSQLRKLKKSDPEAEWWLWWSPSDLIAHGVDEKEIAKCLRVLATDFADTRFLAFVTRDIQSGMGLSLLEYIASVCIDVERKVDGNSITHTWRVAKHPDTKLEGEEIEFKG
ncbi:MAG: hypothetical protein RTU92_04295 [Candidatus Thorarchaeota archaeon]